MAAFNQEIVYYNTFWLKQVTTAAMYSNNPYVDPQDNTLSIGTQSFNAVFPGLPFKAFRVSTNLYNDLYGSSTDILEYDESINFTNSANVSKPKSNVNIISNTFSNTLGSNFVIEESRIRGAFNAPSVELGVRAFVREDSNEAKYRSNALVYSGIYNSRTEFNETNVFSIGEEITRSVDPGYGSIQLIDAMDNDLTIIQENKVNRALIDKDAIFTAEGQALTTAAKIVIGQITPYAGDYGISKNPESFAKYGFRRYFADKYRNAILRLSRDGITEISEYGMKDFFRDNLNTIKDESKTTVTPELLVVGQMPPETIANQIPINELGAFIQVKNALTSSNAPEIGSILEIKDTNTNEFVTTNAIVTGINVTNRLIFLTQAGFSNFITSGENGQGAVRFLTKTKDAVIGAYDSYQDNYVVSLQNSGPSKSDEETSDYYNTLHYDEKVRGWVSFYTYRPDTAFSMKSRYFSTKNGKLYEHYEGGFLGENVFQKITPCDMGNFYGVYSKSNVIFIFNQNPSRLKTFTTIDYEGSNGWQVDFIRTDDKSKLEAAVNGDASKLILSYNEGSYTDSGVTRYAGFVLKENKYYANIVNQSPTRPGEVIFGQSMTGVKGFVAKVSMTTDTTNTGDIKEIFTVASNVI
jgi:hypothetical protein